VRLELKVVPKSSRAQIDGWLGERLKVRVSAPPERGKANAAVEALIAKTLGIPRSAVRVVAGAASPLKTIEIDAPENDVANVLARLKR
jgi:uncharacterized protein (TIGR00251 family)